MLNPYSGVVPDHVIKRNLQKQLELEMGDFVRVESIWQNPSEVDVSLNGVSAKPIFVVGIQ